jgi:hypothetical protein
MVVLELVAGQKWGKQGKRDFIFTALTRGIEKVVLMVINHPELDKVSDYIYV